MEHLLFIVIVIIVLILIFKSRNDNFMYKGLYVGVGNVHPSIIPEKARSCELLKTELQKNCDLYSTDIDSCYEKADSEYYRCKRDVGEFETSGGLPLSLQQKCHDYAKNQCYGSRDYYCYDNQYTNCVIAKAIE